MTAILAIAAVLGVVQAALLPGSAACLAGGWGYAAGLLLWALAGALNLRTLPDFAGDERFKGTRDNLIILWAVVGVIPLVAAMTAATESFPLIASGDPMAVSLTKRGAVAGLRATMLRGYATGLLGGVGLIAVAQWLLTRSSATRARVLAAPVSNRDSLATGSWAIVEGVVRSERAFVRQFARTYLGKYAGTSTSSASHPFVLESADGDIAIGEAGVWAGTRQRHKERTRTWSIESGDRAVAAGRVERTDGGLAMSGKGEESLLLFATGRGSARGFLRGCLRARAVQPVIAAVCAAAVVAVWVLPGA